MIDEINTFRPELVWIALPCTLWGPWTRISYKDRPQELRRLRLKQKKLINLAIEAATVQIAVGNHVAFEHPRDSELWNKPDVKELLQMPHFQEVDFDMCSFGLKAVSDGGLLKKPTKVMCTDPGYAAALHRPCAGDHEHTLTAGQNTKPAGHYTEQFARAVVKGHKSMRKGRRKIWDSLTTAHLGGAVQDHGGPLRGPSEDLTVEKVEDGCAGISFPPHVSKSVATALRRVHQNMGHPSNNDLARHLKLAGASEESVKACHQLHCQTCKRHARSGSRRPAKVFKPLDFNEEVAVDTLHLYDLSGHKVTVLSIMDVGSGYNVVAPVSGRKAEDYTKCFLKSWVAWAGAPQSTLVDQESGLTKDFPEELEKHGIRVNYTAGQAHWQNGHIERQNEWFRQIFDRVKDHVCMQDHEVEWVLASTAQAKNYLRRRHALSGFSGWLLAWEKGYWMRKMTPLRDRPSFLLAINGRGRMRSGRLRARHTCTSRHLRAYNGLSMDDHESNTETSHKDNTSTSTGLQKQQGESPAKGKTLENGSDLGSSWGRKERTSGSHEVVGVYYVLESIFVWPSRRSWEEHFKPRQ